MELSKRLMAVAGLVTEGASVADIGTDHGYVPIYLVEEKKAAHVIAMDINQGPLDKARSNIAAHRLERFIGTRRSDGLNGLEPGEVDAIIAAGMGGGLVIHILEDSPKVVEQLKEMILQPQSEIHKVREYLNKNKYMIFDEDIVEEEGKFYPMMKVIHGEEPEYTMEELYYGRVLLKKAHPVLKKFLKKEKEMTENIIFKLKSQTGQRATERIQELEKDMCRIQNALDRYL